MADPQELPPHKSPPFVIRCAWCNRFRDRDGNWREMTDAPKGRVTHGICPPCLQAQTDDFSGQMDETVRDE